jgi:hypothetical protein
MFDLNTQEINAMTFEIIKTQNILIEDIEATNLFKIGYQKDSIFNSKKEKLRNKRNFIVVTNPTNYHYFSEDIFDHKIIKIEESFLKNNSIEMLLSDFRFENSYVLLTNNNVAAVGLNKYTELYKNLPNTFFIIHDFDNHHWHELSIQLAIFSDAYVPAHQACNSIIGRVNSNIITNIPCGSLQWSKKFLVENKHKIYSNDRSDDPLGMHFYYPKFIYRNSVVNTLSKYSKSTGLRNSNDNNFHNLSIEDRFKEWVEHKFHWIVPVQNDLPIRFFDALITGGIPFVPCSLISYLDNLSIPREYYYTYNFNDIFNPSILLNKVKNEISSSREERFNFAFENYHVDSTIKKIFEKSMKLVENR